MTPHDFAAHGRLLSQTSAGPWRHEWNDDECHECGVDVRDASSLRVALCEFDDDTCLADAALIVALRNSLDAYRAVVLAAWNLVGAYDEHGACVLDDDIDSWLTNMRTALSAFRNVGGGS